MGEFTDSLVHWFIKIESHTRVVPLGLNELINPCLLRITYYALFVVFYMDLRYTLFIIETRQPRGNQQKRSCQKR